MPAGCAPRGSALERTLKRLVHQSGCARAEPLDRQLATPALVGHLREIVKLGAQPVEHGRIGVAQLEQRLGPAGNDALLTRVQIDASRGPDRVRTADFGKTLVDGA